MSPRVRKEWRLVPEPVPPRGARTGLYDRILAEFLAGKDASVRVELPGRKIETVRVSLVAAIRRSDAKVKVITRQGSVYLQR